MSSAQNLPNQTRIIVKDMLFQKKYSLSHTQMDLMAYFVNLAYWTIVIEGYCVIATKKIMSDLPEMGQKTIEASLKKLKEVGLIETTIVEVTQWNGNPRIRGLRLTTNRKEYNSHLVLPSQDKEVIALKKKVKELEAKNEQLTVSTTEDSEKGRNQSVNTRTTEEKPSDFEFAGFINVTKKTFGTSGEPICNFVPTWMKETTFYINSYNKLALLTPKGEYKQLTNPIEINHFWRWLFEHQNRVGKMINFTKPLDLKELKEQYLGVDIVLAKTEFTIEDLVGVEEGVKMKLRNKTNKKGDYFCFGGL